MWESAEMSLYAAIAYLLGIRHGLRQVVRTVRSRTAVVKEGVEAACDTFRRGRDRDRRHASRSARRRAETRFAGCDRAPQSAHGARARPIGRRRLDPALRRR